MAERDLNPEPFDSYLEDLRVNGASKSTLQHYRSILTNANAFKGLPDWNKDDVNKYFLSLENKNKKSSIEVKKIVLKKFLNSQGKKDAVEHLRGKIQINELRREDLLTSDDVTKLIESTESHLWKALIAFLFETGCRIGEATSIKVKDLQETDKGLIVNIPTTKTDAGNRPTILIHSAGYIRNWKNSSNLRKDDLLFKMTKEWANTMIKRIAKDAGITKSVNPHKFRHAAATYACLKGFKEHSLRKKFGWKQSSNVPERYIHLIDDDIIDETLRLEGKESPNTKPINAIKDAEPLNEIDRDMIVSQVKEENEELKKELKDTKEILLKEIEELKEIFKLEEKARAKRELEEDRFEDHLLKLAEKNPEDLKGHLKTIVKAREIEGTLDTEIDKSKISELTEGDLEEYPGIKEQLDETKKLMKESKKNKTRKPKSGP